jgi:hypothetical protein
MIWLAICSEYSYSDFSARIAAMSRTSFFVSSGDDRVAVLDYHYYRYNDIFDMFENGGELHMIYFDQKTTPVSCKWFFSEPKGNEYAFGNCTFQTMPVSGPFIFISSRIESGILA